MPQHPVDAALSPARDRQPGRRGTTPQCRLAVRHPRPGLRRAGLLDGVPRREHAAGDVLARSVSRAAEFTASPMTVYSKRCSCPTLPATTWPVATPMPAPTSGTSTASRAAIARARRAPRSRVVLELDGCAEDREHRVADELC